MYPCVKMKMLRAAALGVLAAGGLLAGCSDIYFDRRETVSSGSGDAVASNIAVQTIDPWPRNVANTNIPMNGQRAELAIQRYRTGRVIPPSGSGTSSAGYQQQQQAPPPAATNTGAQSSAGTQVR